MRLSKQTSPQPDGAAMIAAERTRRRFARRQWRRRWSWWKPILALIVALALVVGGGWLVFFSKYLAVSEVTVTGNELVKQNQVLNAARIADGQALATVDLATIQRRVSALTPVATATVARKWPNTVTISITERTAVAVVAIGDRMRGLDADGILFREYPQRPVALPLIRVGGAPDNTALAEAASVVAAMPKVLSRRVDHLTVETVDQISLVLRDGRIVVWGSAEESAEKAAVLGQLLRRQARVYDVSVPGQPTTRTTVPPGLG